MFPYTNLNRQPLSEISCCKSYNTNGILYKTFTDSLRTLVSFVDWKVYQTLFRQLNCTGNLYFKFMHLRNHCTCMLTISDQEASLIAFYKAYNVNWACPLKTRLEGVFYSSFLKIFCGENRLHEVHKNSNSLFFFLGDPAIGECKPFNIFNDYTETEMWFSPKPWHTHTSSMSESTVLKFGLL